MLIPTPSLALLLRPRGPDDGGPDEADAEAGVADDDGVVVLEGGAELVLYMLVATVDESEVVKEEDEALVEGMEDETARDTVAPGQIVLNVLLNIA